MTTPLGQALTLPCGLVLPNRIVKSAVSEYLAESDGKVLTDHVALYQRWAEGGAGALITGNVMVDRRYPEAPGNIIIDPADGLKVRDDLKRLSDAVRQGPARIIMQVNHAGRQCPSVCCERPVAPSAVPMKFGRGGFLSFAPPRALTEDEIEDIIGRFVHAISVAQTSGFDGVQIQAAHGFLISQFLSPRTNLRTDNWGGTLENRSRILMEIFRRARELTGNEFAIGVKLNAADFQRGGLTFEDVLELVGWLHTERVDFIEISGGNYEQPQMFGVDGESHVYSDGRLKASIVAEEAYFAEYASAIRDVSTIPVIASGGFRTREAMEMTIDFRRADAIGLARPLCIDPYAPKGLISEQLADLHHIAPPASGLSAHVFGAKSPFPWVRALHRYANITWYAYQVLKLARTGRAAPNEGLFSALLAQRGFFKTHNKS